MLKHLLIDISPLRASREYRVLFTAQAMATLAGQMIQVAVPIQVFQLTHSSFAVGGLGLAQLAPLVIFAIAGGAVADAVDRRKLLLFGYAARALVAALFLTNSLLPAPSLVLLYALLVINTAIQSVTRPAAAAVLPKLLPRHQILAAQTLFNLYFNLTGVAGPALGGVAIAVAGLPFTYAINLAGLLATVALVAVLAPLPPVENAARAGLNSVLDGLRFVCTQPALLGIFLVDTNAMVFGMSTALFPALGERLGGGASTTGLLFASISFGSLVAVAFSGWMRHIQRQGLAVNLAVFGWGVSIVLFGLSNQLWLALVFLALAGAADNVSGVFRSTILLQASPDAMRGRMSGVEYAQVAAAPALGDFEAGVVASLTSVRTSIVSGGVACIAGVFILMAILPAFNRYRPPGSPILAEAPA